MVTLLLALSLSPLSPVFAGTVCDYEGDALPPLRLKGVDGKAVSTDDFRKAVLVVHFWASWAPPSVLEMPSIDALRKRIGEEKIAVVAVNYGESIETVERFLKEHPVSFPVLFDLAMKGAESWKVNEVPVSYVVDPNGKIRYTVSGGTNWDSPEVEAVLRPLLDEKQAEQEAAPPQAFVSPGSRAARKRSGCSG